MAARAGITSQRRDDELVGRCDDLIDQIIHHIDVAPRLFGRIFVCFDMIEMNSV